MKKNNKKTRSPAPATNAKSAAKKVALKQPSAAPVAPAAVAPAAPASVPASVKAVSAAPVQTRIVAQIDVGFGNALYVRGDGPGLSWNQGTPMECVANDRWELTLSESSRPVSFKVLLNDATWCTGADSVVASGGTAIVTPEFA
jgi:hypothetical protein